MAGFYLQRIRVWRRLLRAAIGGLQTLLAWTDLSSRGYKDSLGEFDYTELGWILRGEPGTIRDGD